MKNYKCNKCQHEWYSILDRKPKVCPRCKSYKYDDKKKMENEKKINTFELVDWSIDEE